VAVQHRGGLHLRTSPRSFRASAFD
jgi:hypothetical protein